MIEFFTGSLRGSSDLASRRMLLLLGEAGVSLVLALTQLFIFVSDFSRITFFDGLCGLVSALLGDSS